MTVLGIDYGTVRIGLALGDSATSVASPWKVLENKGRIALVARLADIVKDEHIKVVVVGYPRTLKGEAAHMAHMIDDFVADLREVVEAQIVLEDERMSSLQADRSLAAGARSSRDALAAAAILETFLARQRRR